MKTIWAHIVVSGRVQGVGFRESTRIEAHRIGVFGWVRNLPSGKVEATVSGSEQDVERLIEFVQSGPPGARVDGVEVVRSHDGERYTDFVITR